jgi:3-oxoacyl-(acyl-carrier-protein) synthase
VTGVAVRAIGLVTGWGRGVAALPADARVAADGRAVIAVQPTPRTSDRLRRATRECLLGVDAVDALLADGALAREDIAGSGTALVYVTAAAYGASNRAFVEGGGGALHFPYTAPSAVPAEVAIEFGLHGPYAVLIGGAAATIDAITHAATLLARGACKRAIVLAVETFTECADLLARGGAIGDGPLVEAAVAALFEPATAGGLGGARAPPMYTIGLGGASRVPPLPIRSRHSRARP